MIKNYTDGEESVKFSTDWKDGYKNNAVRENRA